MDRLKGKRCLVTAAGQGIGRATALAMAAEGGAGARHRHRRRQARRTCEAEGIADRAARRARPRGDRAPLARRGGPLDVLFNCAGCVEHGTILDTDEEKWAFSLDLNVTAMYRMMPRLPAGDDRAAAAARSSTWPRSPRRSSAVPNRFAYGATKAAVIGLTKSVAADFVDAGHPLQRDLPGHGREPVARGRGCARSGDYETARAAFVARQPMGRLGRPEEIAALAVYLASDESAFTTGVAHVIDGGWTNV